jgi:hypothetical protein
MASQPRGVHFVGSINLPTTSDIFDQIPSALGQHLHRLPDGETGARENFVGWQMTDAFLAAPEVLVKRDSTGKVLPEEGTISKEQIAAAVKKLGNLTTEFDTHALASYAIFASAKAAGHIPPHTRFQVSLPGVANVIIGLSPSYRLAIEPLYEAALLRSLSNIQSSIPHDQLAIQIDVAVEIGLLEKVSIWVPYFSPVFSGIIDRLSRLADQVAQDVQLGFHLCYGDIGHAHFVQPQDLGLLVEVANALYQSLNHPIQWLHVPVPKDRKDAPFFAPLRKLEWEIPELYLGCVHAGDEEGTRERIATAKEVLGHIEFGVATECGLGRTPKEELESILSISKAVSAPVTGYAANN